MKDEIKKLFHNLEDKTAFILHLSEILNKSPNTLRHHWFSNYGFWAIPEKYVVEVYEELKQFKNK